MVPIFDLGQKLGFPPVVSRPVYYNRAYFHKALHSRSGLILFLSTMGLPLKLLNFSNLVQNYLFAIGWLCAYQQSHCELLGGHLP